MSPNERSPTGVAFETDTEVKTKDNVYDSKHYEYRFLPRNVAFFLSAHLFGLYGIYLVFTSAKILTVIQAIILSQIGEMGINCAAHRLWAHRTYKANTPLKIILAIMNTLVFQNNMIVWCRNHRLHHKYSDTDADPHNASRGFFHAQMGWLLTRRHPALKAKLNSIDISDLTSDPILVFQQKYYKPLVFLISVVIPTLVPIFLWHETFLTSFSINALRYCMSLNFTGLVNSAAHLYGNKPYNRFINPRENVTVSLLSAGEGYHNYHHTFPWDYKAAELGKYSYNISTNFIDFFAKIGWAYDLKSVSLDSVKRRMQRTGDDPHIWGWNDKDMLKEDIDGTVITNKSNESHKIQ